MSPLNSRKQTKATVLLTLDWLFGGLWCCHFLLPQESNLDNVGAGHENVQLRWSKTSDDHLHPVPSVR